MTYTEKAAKLATARFGEQKARNRLALAQMEESLASGLASSTFEAIPGVGLASDEATEAARARHEEAREIHAAARRVVKEAVDAYHDALERQQAVYDAPAEC